MTLLTFLASSLSSPTTIPNAVLASPWTWAPEHVFFLSQSSFLWLTPTYPIKVQFRSAPPPRRDLLPPSKAELYTISGISTASYWIIHRSLASSLISSDPNFTSELGLMRKLLLLFLKNDFSSQLTYKTGKSQTRWIIKPLPVLLTHPRTLYIQMLSSHAP